MKRHFKTFPIVICSTLLMGCSLFGGNPVTIREDTPEEILERATPINSIEDLNQLKNSYQTFKLVKDLDFSNKTSWTPISGFKGELLGEGYNLTNFNFEYVAEDYIGLFSTLEGTVSNLTISGSLLAQGGCNYVGLLAGKNTGKIENVKSYGTVSAQYSSYVGGVVGYTKENIKGCENNATVTGLDNVGGIAGYLFLSHNKSLLGGSNNKGNISGQNKIAGLFGAVYGNSYSYNGYDIEVKIPNSNNSGNITGTKDYTGGVVGYVSAGQYGDDITISYCSNTGAINGLNYVSGIVGGGTTDLYKIEFCNNTADITGTGKYVGGYVGGSDGGIISGAINNNSITGGTYVGGIAGRASSLSDCENKGPVKCTDQDTVDGATVARFGGVAGSAKKVNNCTNSGTLIFNTLGGRVGGVAGELTLSNAAQKVDGNKNTVDISCQGGDVGGVFGYVIITAPSYAQSFNVEFKRNENSGVIHSNSSRVGGIAGQIYSNYAWATTNGGIVSFNSNKNTANITGFHYVGGLVGYARKVNDDANVWATNTQTGEITATAGDGTQGNYYGLINGD